MYEISAGTQKLVAHLEKSGMEKNLIPGFVWSLKSCLLANANLSSEEINERLESLGWYGIKLDDDTLGLAAACIKAENGMKPSRKDHLVFVREYPSKLPPIKNSIESSAYTKSSARSVRDLSGCQ